MRKAICRLYPPVQAQWKYSRNPPGGKGIPKRLKFFPKADSLFVRLKSAWSFDRQWKTRARGFVTGHDFSRADKPNTINRALAPAERIRAVSQ